MWSSVRSVLALLSPRDRRILLVLVLIQVGLAFLDLIGVLLFGLVAAISAASISGEQPALITNLFGRLGISLDNELSVAIGLAVAAGLLLTIKSLLGFLLLRRTYRFLANRQAIISSELANRLFAQPLLFLQRRTSQNTAYALTGGVNTATLGLIGGSVLLAADTAVLMTLFLGVLAIDPLVAIFTLLFFALIAVVLARILGGWASRLGTRQAAAEIQSYASVQTAIRTYREMSVLARRGWVVERFERLRWNAARVQSDVTIMELVPKYVFEIMLIIGAGLLAYSQFLTRDLVAAVAVIAVFLAATSRVVPALLRIQGALLMMRRSVTSAEPTLELIRELNDVRPHISNVETPPQNLDRSGFFGSFLVDTVTFTYPGADRPAVSGVSLFAPPGTSLALVGSTGAGKSTLADLILGILRPDAGEVSIGGYEPSEAVQHWPGAIAYVPQDITVIDGTIRDNVALGLPTDLIDDDAVWEALERAQLADFLRGEREGIDTVVGEHGVRLSGGQRQRLGLARALYSRPKLLVLDEATSALDAETEQAVARALDALEGDVTVVIVAHRLATIRHCDQVAYLDQGHLKALGTFDEVRAAQPAFDRQAELLGL